MQEIRRDGIGFFNNLLVEGDYTSANKEHYPNPYKWDLAQIAIARARLGDTDGAAADINQIFVGMHKNGFIPNVRFMNGRFHDPERMTFNDKNESSYTQPPLEAQAAMETYKAYAKQGKQTEGRDFLKKIFGNLETAYGYFAKFRENKNDELVGVIHMHETGRDSGPDADKLFKNLRLPTVGKSTPRLIGYANSAIDYASALALNIRLRAENWDPVKIRDKKIFWMNDVMFNAMYAKNLYEMAEISEILGESNKKDFYTQKAKSVEKQILDKMWDQNTSNPMFYSLDADGAHIKKITVSNLFPIILPNVSETQVKKIISLLEDPNWFGTPYPIPSVPTNAAEYDPHFREKRLWRGPVWINMNWHIAEALFMQATRFKNTNPELAERLKNRGLFIVKKTTEMTNEEGFWEFYDAENGKGYRITPFGWSGMSKALEHDYHQDIDDAVLEMEKVAAAAWNKKEAEDKRRKQKLENQGVFYKAVSRILEKV